MSIAKQSSLVFFLVALAFTTSVFAQRGGGQPRGTNLLSGVKVPPGFNVTLYASPTNVSYPVCLAAAPTGELFVGVDENGSLDARPNRGRVIRCVDKDGDGKADEFKVFASMDSPRGIWFDNNTLYVMHPPFVSAFHDDNGDGVSDRSEVLVEGLGRDLKFRGADHTVNGMRMGIDGWLYIAVGDYGAIQAVGKDGARLQIFGGGIARVRPDGTGLERVSSGQRNIYDVAVSPELDLFTRDNTNDGGGWDVRLSHVIMNGYYGYPSAFKNFSDEIIKPLADYGGGSPCGSLFLDEPGFPPEFGSALYTVEWGRNAVLRHPLERVGASFKAGQVSFVEIQRPTDMDVDGEGRLYISSWLGAQFTYAGPNAGFVVRVTPEGHKAVPFPDLKAASNERLLELLQSPSAVCRLHTQREILRRGSNRVFVRGLEQIARAEAPASARVAAIFTLKQLEGERSHRALAQLARAEPVREFALRALADNVREAGDAPLPVFTDALKDSNPRVRLQAVVGLGRIGKAQTAKALLPLVADGDPIVAHGAVQSLVALRAGAVCLQAFDSSTTANLAVGAGRVLQALHEPEVVDGLIRRLSEPRESASRQAMLRALCRLYQREATWDGKWWGTRPDTSGPYFTAENWEASDKIAMTLRQELLASTGESQAWLALELLKNKVAPTELLPIINTVAEGNTALRTAVVDLFLGYPTLPPGAVDLLVRVATKSDESEDLRARALRGLQRVTTGRGVTFETTSKIFSTIATADTLSGSLASMWEEYTRDARNAQNVQRFVSLAQSESRGERLLGYCVLVNLANHQVAAASAKEIAARAVEKAWAEPKSTVTLLEAIVRTRADQYNHQVRSLLNDARPEVKKVAMLAAERLELNKASTPNQKTIDALPYEDVVTTATREAGDVRAGTQLFLKQGCNACHTVAAGETPKGPSLVDIATRYSRAELCESILKPNAKIAQGFETQWFTPANGEDIEGFVVSEAGDSIELRNIVGVTTTLAKKDIKNRGKRETSMMPQGLADKLTPQELASLLAYLESLKSN